MSSSLSADTQAVACRREHAQARLACAQAQPNIALVKYWGKRDPVLNLPAAGSLSITLDALWTRTQVHFDKRLSHDTLELNGQPQDATRVSACLDLLRAAGDCPWRAQVRSRNNFPTAAGLASSASGFAALVVAASAALDLNLSPRQLSVFARQGSGSAARSLFGGFATMDAGTRADGTDACAHPLLPPDAWPLEVVVAITDPGAKTVGSSGGMRSSRGSSPFYPAWVASVPADLAQAQAAVRARDFDALAEVAEHNCLKMHAVMLSSRPPLRYWSGTTVACMERIRGLREQEGRKVFFTVDAGPQVKAVCLPAEADAVAAALATVPGVQQVLRSRLGAGARRITSLEDPVPW